MYEAPEMEVVVFEEEDVITTSLEFGDIEIGEDNEGMGDLQ